MRELAFRQSIADSISNSISRRRQNRITADDVKIINESVRVENGALQVAFFVQASTGAIVPGDVLTRAVLDQSDQIANSVSFDSNYPFDNIII